MDLNQFRWDLIRPDVKPEYQNLCNNSNPVRTLLFGDDVLTQLKELSDASRVSRRLHRRRKPAGSRPFRGRGRAIYRSGQRPFLGRGKGPQRQSPNMARPFTK
ncbi:hypothetical protein HOLleu_03823 [Holothuria leucospilota]|uniref:Uncharacterized protein n=1 Tax=Holothuria leucospilota TaxID=206669 RepID=A0A9Q1CT27_HOLLE|nr:hypothetical protein HOLleu_03823 [Holothuria leucospilota]